jgi:hypothetical protein
MNRIFIVLKTISTPSQIEIKETQAQINQK